MEAISAAVLVKALDGLAMRQTATAQNIANAGTPGYAPLRVSFEAALREAAGRGEAAVAAVMPRLGPATGDEAGRGLRLDLELAAASGTALRYAALVELLGRRMQLDALAISGGR